MGERAIVTGAAPPFDDLDRGYVVLALDPFKRLPDRSNEDSFREPTFLCDTLVPQNMSADTDAGADGEMEKINVRVPETLLAEIDDVWEERGYAHKSEFIRDALRDAVEPSTQLSEEALQHLAESREQREDGDTVSQADVKDHLDIDD